MLEIVASLTNDSRRVIYDRNMFVVQATFLKNCRKIFLKIEANTNYVPLLRQCVTPVTRLNKLFAIIFKTLSE
jgi:hypothetical protein